MNRHASGLLTIVAVQLAAIFADQTTPLVAKLACAAATLLTLLVADPVRQQKATTIVLGIAGLAVPILTFALTRMPTGALAANVCTTLLGVFVRLPALLPTRSDRDIGPAPPTAAALVLVVAVGMAAGCRNVTPDQFASAVVDCAAVNPEASAALAQVETCLVAAAVSNPGACVAGLVTEAHFTVDEVACVVAYVAERENAKVVDGTATETDLAMRQSANDWLTTEQIRIRNTYVLR